MSSPLKSSAKLTVFPLAMLITGAIDSIRNLPGTALYGSGLFFFACLAAIFFLLPTGLVSASLTARFPKQGGIYEWTRLAFGKYPACLAIWLQWINTMVWFPTILSFVAGTLAYLINPALAQHKLFLLSVILVSFWSLTLLNLFGLKIAAKFASICTILGMLIPMVLIIVLGLIWVHQGQAVAIHINRHTLLPNFGLAQNWSTLTMVMAAFLGMELACVHVRQADKPSITFPRALFLSIFIILITLIAGSLSIAVVIPNEKINLVAGVMQTFSAYLTAYHLSWFLPILTVMILIGSLGGMINWLISPAKGLMQAAEDAFLPQWICKRNQHNMPGRLLIIQAVIVTLIACAYLLMPSVNSSYWLLTDLSTQLYMLMYILLFLSALKLNHAHPHNQNNLVVARSSSFIICCILGIIGCLTSLWVGFIPPSAAIVGGTTHHVLLMFCGILGLTFPVIFLWLYRFITQSKTRP
jgi:amino acid transporter